MTEPVLDSVNGCRTELEFVSRELSRLNVEYASRLRRLAVAEVELAAEEAKAFLGASGETATAKKHQAALTLQDSGISRTVAELKGETEYLKVLTRGLEARGSRAQSALNSHLSEEKLSGYRREG